MKRKVCLLDELLKLNCVQVDDEFGKYEESQSGIEMSLEEMVTDAPLMMCYEWCVCIASTWREYCFIWDFSLPATFTLHYVLFLCRLQGSVSCHSSPDLKSLMLT